MNFLGEDIQLEPITAPRGETIPWAFRVTEGIAGIRNRLRDIQTVDGLTSLNQLMAQRPVIVFDALRAEDFHNDDLLSRIDHHVGTYRRGIGWHNEYYARSNDDPRIFGFFARGKREIPTEFRRAEGGVIYSHSHESGRLVLFDDKKVEHSLPPTPDLIRAPRNSIYSVEIKQK